VDLVHVSNARYTSTDPLLLSLCGTSVHRVSAGLLPVEPFTKRNRSMLAVRTLTNIDGSPRPAAAAEREQHARFG
jgi:hypothetical protein